MPANHRLEVVGGRKA